MSRNGLLATKFALPGPPPGAIARPRLLDALDGCAERPLTLVAAPAGSGKSALAGARGGAGRRPGGIGQERAGERLGGGGTRAGPGRLAVAGRLGRRPGAVLARRRRRAG